MTLRAEMLSVWKETASRQRERRRKSEDENSRLRERVIDQREVIRSLQRILERQLAESTTNDPIASSRLHIPSWRAVCAGGDPCRMMRIFTELTADLKQVRASTDTWVQVSPPSLLTAGRFINTRIVPLSPTSLAVETVNLRLMPFAFDAVGGTYWLQCVNSHCLNFDYFREKADVEGRETVFCGQAFHDVVADHVPTNVRLRTQLSIQNFEEGSRMLVVSSARSESVHIGDQELRGTKLKEQYWNVFQPPEPNEQDACLMMSFGRVTMDFETGVSKSPLAVLTLTKYFGGRLHQQLDSAVTMIEDKLLGE
ncbi:hypothetical protein Poli38472_007538 [Pythium oligandrum]|uniref:Uncharacterized protein n=1 Tax=Pythium oligandrum TaxID=41045 RepID=A0A8K1CQC3_PYTOL|nr:hypothetical protein Poli38472_007538 [Pythium oligandrum]|eukprot:TMW67866.1 hypothetical protein Poli38472_007538 [Pythium oligandrum]